jgi:Plasmid pRiA4b ORF-3-like protein
MVKVSQPQAGSVYQLRVVLARISPLIWRRLLVTDATSVAGLHAVLQTAFGWSDEHLHRFTIHAVEYGLWREGTTGFSHDARTVPLSRFALRPGERFTYEYDFFDAWIHDIRVEQILPRRARGTYPVCTAGARSAPPEDCGGPEAFLALRQRFSRYEVTLRLAQLLTPLMDAPQEALVGDLIGEHREELTALARWAQIDDFDRAGLNRALRALPSGEVTT